MNLIYFDESGNSGTNLADPQQPIFVLGALIVVGAIMPAEFNTDPLGIGKALRHGGRFDLLSSIAVFVGYAVMPLTLGMLLKMLFCGTVDNLWDVFPAAGFQSEFHQRHGEAFIPGVGALHGLRVPHGNAVFAQLGQVRANCLGIERDEHIDVWRVLHEQRDIPAWMNEA
jgi:ABC-type dipeptide/oligopeptide/nickel transport system permease component